MGMVYLMSHSLNVPCQYINKHRSEDGSLEPKHVANYILLTIHVLCLTEEFTISHYKHNGMAPLTKNSSMPLWFSKSFVHIIIFFILTCIIVTETSMLFSAHMCTVCSYTACTVSTWFAFRRR
jgi:hypothetical protein